MFNILIFPLLSLSFAFLDFVFRREKKLTKQTKKCCGTRERELPLPEGPNNQAAFLSSRSQNIKLEKTRGGKK